MHKYLIDHLLNLILLKEKRDLAKIKFKKIKVAEIASVFFGILIGNYCGYRENKIILKLF